MDKFIGFPYPIVKNPRGYFAKTSGVDKIKADLLALLLTYPGERCFTGDTQISLANGLEMPIKDLIDKDCFWVYSYDSELNAIVPGKATAHKTVLNAELMEIELDNGESIKCTPNHLWMLRNGDYIRADELTSGTSLMPLYRNLNTSGYERIYQPYLKDYKETHLCFAFEERLSGIREVVHHKDLNKRNNSPDNLQWMTCEDHINLHKEINNAFIEKIKNNSDFKQEWIEKIKNGLKKYYELNEGHRKGVKLSDETKRKLSESKNNFYKTEEGIKQKENLKNISLEYYKNNSHPMLGKKLDEETRDKMRGPRSSMSGENNPSKRPEVREKIRKYHEDKRKEKNHKVLSVKKLDYREDCYDLHVAKYHNFALSAGVFVHNCMLPTYGTPLKDLMFDPNDATVAVAAKQMIIESIDTWEPRVVIDDIEVTIGGDRSILNRDDDLSSADSILNIRIAFRDPEEITEAQELVLEVPLPNG